MNYKLKYLPAERPAMYTIISFIQDESRQQLMRRELIIWTIRVSNFVICAISHTYYSIPFEFFRWGFVQNHLKPETRPCQHIF